MRFVNVLCFAPVAAGALNPGTEQPATTAPSVPPDPPSFLTEYMAEAGVVGAIGTLIVAGLTVWIRRQRR